MEFSDIIRFLLGDYILGLRWEIPPNQPNEPHETSRHVAPQFEQRIWPLEREGDGLLPMPGDLLADLDASDGRPGLYVESFAPPADEIGHRRPLHTDDGVHRDSAAVIRSVLESLPTHSRVVFLAPIGVVVSRSSERLRAEIEQRHAITWVIYMSNRYGRFPDLNHAFEFALLSCEVGAGPAQLTRLVNLRASEPADWRRKLEAAGRRSGGEVGNSIVLRNTRLGGVPWTYDRWTKTLASLRDDSITLGQLRPLRELVLPLCRVCTTRDSARLQTVEDAEGPAAGSCP